MRKIPPEKDPLGHAGRQYFHTGNKDEIFVESTIAEDDSIPVEYLFDGSKLPDLEKLALEKCSDRILDIGAAAGRHSLLLQEQNLDVTAIEISGLCCDVMRERGIKKVICEDFFYYKNSLFDTLLCLMNGIGIAGTLEGLDRFLAKAYELLASGGKVLFDSSDIDYMYYEEDGSKWVDLNSRYYGELEYTMSYKNIQGDLFPWLFIDFDTLDPIARKHGFEPKLLARGEHYDYLGVLYKE